ncbi:MAG: hypothetical protein KBS67_03215, partial [Bacteroidales bacterium]|nr:hypothetical protein [Candidatus Cryptobacteroides equifaecalis]
KVKAADKLSTFVVQLFAHDAKMRNTVLRREMLVTLPVQLTAQPPRYLYDGDRCLLRFSLSNNFDRTVRGTFSAEGRDIRVVVPANGTVPVGIDLDVMGLAGGEKTVTAIFRPEDAGLAGDAVRISIPVRSQRQTLTEAHSAVLPSGADPRALEEELRSRFVNAPGASASLSCISIREMLDEALPEFLAPRADNVIDNLNALYSDALLRRMGRQGLDDRKRDEIMGKVLGCLNSDGGFAWFKGMKSSPMITAWVMETSARAGLEGIVNAATAAYLDASILGEENTPAFRFMPCSVEAYAYVRSLYPQFAFKTSALDRKALRKFRKSLKKSLVPSGDRGKQGNTSGKVRRVLTLNALLDAPELARAWGLGSVGKLRRSAEADMESLRQYACPHHSGGMYYPGASGAMFHMLDGELYVHTLLCELFEGTEIADGIRLWFMLQKESQQWKNDPAFVEALACVQKAPQKILDTKVMALSADFTLPFDDIRAAGNGFKVQTAYFKDGKPLAEGDSLKVGDRITVVTDFSSDDMRSFVRLTVPRPANLRPVDQKSSIFWGGWYAVRADRTEYWLETCSERMQVREDCYVTAEGCFHSAARSIECLYAPHYRANEKAPGALVSRF